VAVKVLSAKASEDPERLERFEQRAHAVAVLFHPDVLGIHDFGADGGVTCVVTELLGEKRQSVLRFEAGVSAPGLQEMADGLTVVVARELSVLGEGETSTAEAGCGVDCGEHLS